MADLTGTKILMIAADGFETVELFKPRQAFEDAGAEVTLASIKTDPIQGMKEDINPAEKATPDLTLADVEIGDYAALVIPGGTCNPDKLRVEDDALAIVRGFVDAGKTVAAICHAPWLLAEAGVIDGKRVTGFKSIRTDLTNAGGTVVEDEEVVIDGNLITSRCPDDIPAFNDAIVQALTRETADA